MSTEQQRSDGPPSPNAANLRAHTLPGSRPHDDGPLANTPARPMQLPELGRYQVLQSLGRGTFGEVFAAYDPVVGRHVALKVLLDANFAPDPEKHERFRREVRALGSLDHPNVVRIYDASLDTPPRFIAMELCSGPSLGHVLATTNQLPPGPAIWVIQSLAQALDAIHQRSLIHRDIKPDNILFHHGTLKLADFGIARDATNPLMITQGALGTPAFMSPEQLNGEVTDFRVDLYAMGTLLYYMLSGRYLFDETTLASFVRRLNEDPPKISDRVHGLSPEWDRFFSRALHRKPAERFQCGEEFCSALQSLVEPSLIRPIANLQQWQTELPTLDHPRSAIPPTSLRCFAPETTVNTSQSSATINADDAGLFDSSMDIPVASNDQSFEQVAAKFKKRSFWAAIVAFAILCGTFLGLLTRPDSSKTNFEPAKIGSVAAPAEPIFGPASPTDAIQPVAPEGIGIVSQPTSAAPREIEPVTLRERPGKLPAQLEPTAPNLSRVLPAPKVPASGTELKRIPPTPSTAANPAPLAESGPSAESGSGASDHSSTQSDSTNATSSERKAEMEKHNEEPENAAPPSPPLTPPTKIEKKRDAPPASF